MSSNHLPPPAFIIARNEKNRFRIELRPTRQWELAAGLKGQGGSDEIEEMRQQLVTGSSLATGGH